MNTINMLAHNAHIWALCTLPPLALQQPEHYSNDKDVTRPPAIAKQAKIKR
jgi:hypothetical protein